MLYLYRTKQIIMRTIEEIIARKKLGIDCSEAESSEVKGFMKDNIAKLNPEMPLLFILEYSEVIDEMKPEKDEIDYSETNWKMDKFMPEESEVQDEYYEILGQQGGDKQTQLEEFFETHADEDALSSRLPEDGTLSGFCEYLISNNKS